MAPIEARRFRGDGPAGDLRAGDLAGDLTTRSLAGDLRGDLAGGLAGDLAGDLATRFGAIVRGARAAGRRDVGGLRGRGWLEGQGKVKNRNL